jgi:hypothetical protein
VTTWNVYGDVRYQNEIGPGGIAAQIESAPHAFLKKILRTKPGRVVSLLAALRSLSGNGRRAWMIEEPLTPEQAKQTIAKIIASDDWNFAWRITEPMRRVKSRFISCLR